jgi:hypothetical protein
MDQSSKGMDAKDITARIALLEAATGGPEMSEPTARPTRNSCRYLLLTPSICAYSPLPGSRRESYH